METSAQKVTVIGYDGSEAADAALRCAARRAVPGTKVVVAYVATAPSEFLNSIYHDKELERSRERAAEVLEGVAARVDGGVDVETVVLSGPPARSLVTLAHEVGADSIAVGSRGFGTYRAAALGSTSHALLHEADVPVLLITRRAVQREGRRTGQPETGRKTTIVTGYDGSDNARAALDYAVERVGAAGAGRVVATYAYDAPSDLLGSPYFQRALTEHQQRGREVLHELEQQGLAAGELETDLVEGPPPEALIRVAHAHDADEIVVGARGLGRFRGALGSVSHELLHEADLPLVVIPPSADG